MQLQQVMIQANYCLIHHIQIFIKLFQKSKVIFAILLAALNLNQYSKILATTSGIYNLKSPFLYELHNIVRDT